jgi:predicted dehydrogenase
MWPERITCVAKGYRDHKREEIAFISSEFENRIIGHMHLSWLMPGKTRLVRVSGSKNAAEIDCLSQEVNVSDGQKRYSLDVNENNTIRSELEHFLECIRSSGREHANYNNGTIGARVVELLEASKRSIEQCRTVSVNSLEF